jgi:carbon monoxide dehydrogenase subunit G
MALLTAPPPYASIRRLATDFTTIRGTCTSRIPHHKGLDPKMKFTGDLIIDAPREAVFAKVRDARFFASCVEGVQELNEIDPEHYTAVLETKVAYLKFRFNVTVEVTRMDAPREIEAKVEGTPLGIVGRLTATSITRLADEGAGTRVSYEIDAALTGKLGSLGQPVLRSKAKEMERIFTQRIRAAFAPAGTGATS